MYDIKKIKNINKISINDDNGISCKNLIGVSSENDALDHFITLEVQSDCAKDILELQPLIPFRRSKCSHWKRTGRKSSVTEILLCRYSHIKCECPIGIRHRIHER